MNLSALFTVVVVFFSTITTLIAPPPTPKGSAKVENTFAPPTVNRHASSFNSKTVTGQPASSKPTLTVDTDAINAEKLVADIKGLASEGSTSNTIYYGYKNVIKEAITILRREGSVRKMKAIDYDAGSGKDSPKSIMWHIFYTDTQGRKSHVRVSQLDLLNKYHTSEFINWIQI